MKLKSGTFFHLNVLLFVGLAIVGLVSSLPAHAQIPLDENCVVSILNRSARVQEDGFWRLDNVPVDFGPTRARATCVVDGETLSGQSDFFELTANQGNGFNADIPVGAPDPVPARLAIAALAGPLASEGAEATLAVTAHFPDGSSQAVGQVNGISYTSSNAALVEVSPTGTVTARMSGTAAITALYDGVIAMVLVQVQLGGDSDGDGIPDALELANGLDPDDPMDGMEDADGDGLTNKQELVDLGTDFQVADTDGDGIDDGEEVVAGADGFVTNPLAVDSDGDGVRDALEIATGSDPTDPASFDLAAALTGITVDPANFVLIFNTVTGDASRRLTVTGTLLDGTSLDLTSPAKGTMYVSSDLLVCNFGAEAGRVFAGGDGTCTVTATNNGFNAQAAGVVTSFAPLALANLPLAGTLRSVDLAGNRAYVAAGEAGLHVVDISDPAQPARIAGLGTPGEALDIRVVGGTAYIADGIAGLVIVDVSDPARPMMLGSEDTGGIARDVAVAGANAYVADGPGGLVVIDVTDSSDPRTIATLATEGDAQGVAVAGDLAVLAEASPGNRLSVIDIASPDAPATFGAVGLPGQGVDVELADGIAHVAVSRDGYATVDLADPSAPVLLGRSRDFQPRDLALSETLVLAADGVFVNAIPIADVSDPGNPALRDIVDFAELGVFDGTGIAITPELVFVTANADVAGPPDGRLLIGQYRTLSDSDGIPPSVVLVQPAPGELVLEGQPLTVTAVADDDVGVAAVEFLVDGALAFVDTSAPFLFPYMVPTGVVRLDFQARAIDFGDNAATSAGITVTVVPDPLTTAVGRIEDVSGGGIADALVACQEDFVGASVADGGFAIADVPTARGAIRCEASLVDASGNTLRGLSAAVSPVPDGVSDVGAIVLAVVPPKLYGATHQGPDGQSTLYTIDPVTGEASEIGPIGFERVSAMDYERLTGRLLAAAERADGSDIHVLLVVDPVTGQGTEIGPTGVEGFGFNETVAGMSIRPSDGVLFGYIESDDLLGTLDTGTGAATAVGSVTVSERGNGLAFSPDDALLHGNQNTVNTIDPATGVVTASVPLSFPPEISSVGRINSMDHNPATGVLYAIVNDSNSGRGDSSSHYGSCFCLLGDTRLGFGFGSEAGSGRRWLPSDEGPHEGRPGGEDDVAGNGA